MDSKDRSEDSIESRLNRARAQLGEARKRAQRTYENSTRILNRRTNQSSSDDSSETLHGLPELPKVRSSGNPMSLEAFEAYQQKRAEQDQLERIADESHPEYKILALDPFAFSRSDHYDSLKKNESFDLAVVRTVDTAKEVLRGRGYDMLILSDPAQNLSSSVMEYVKRMHPNMSVIVENSSSNPDFIDKCRQYGASAIVRRSEDLERTIGKVRGIQRKKAQRMLAGKGRVLDSPLPSQENPAQIYDGQSTQTGKPTSVIYQKK